MAALLLEQTWGASPSPPPPLPQWELYTGNLPCPLHRISWLMMMEKLNFCTVHILFSTEDLHASLGSLNKVSLQFTQIIPYRYPSILCYFWHFRAQTLRNAAWVWEKETGQNLGNIGLQDTLGEIWSGQELTLAISQIILLTANLEQVITPRMLSQSTVPMCAVFRVSHKINPWLLVVIKEQKYFWRGRMYIVLS